jgi:hypothetical protein
MAHVSRMRKRPQVHCTVVLNKLTVNANIRKLSDGMDALVWLIRKSGGSLRYRDALREMRNPDKFGKWLTEHLRHQQNEREVRRNGRR